MNWALFFQIVGTLIVALLGGWLGHSLSARRDLANERRKLRIQYLLEAYRRLESASNRGSEPEHFRQMESAIADIQLLGSAEQVELARIFSKEMSQRGTALLDPLMSSLRNSLRDELKLEPIGSSIIYMRLVLPTKN